MKVQDLSVPMSTRALTRHFPKGTVSFGGSLGLPQKKHTFNSHFNLKTVWALNSED